MGHTEIEFVILILILRIKNETLHKHNKYVRFDVSNNRQTYENKIKITI